MSIFLQCGSFAISMLAAAGIAWLVIVAQRRRRTAIVELSSALAGARVAYGALAGFPLRLLIANRGISFSCEAVIAARSFKAPPAVGAWSERVLPLEHDWFKANEHFFGQVAAARSAIASLDRALQRLQAAIGAIDKLKGAPLELYPERGAAVHLCEHMRIVVADMALRVQCSDETQSRLEQEIRHSRRESGDVT